MFLHAFDCFVIGWGLMTVTEGIDTFFNKAVYYLGFLFKLGSLFFLIKGVRTLIQLYLP